MVIYCKFIALFKKVYWYFVPFFWFFVPKKSGAQQTNVEYSIGIVTYVNRYDLFFKPLIRNLISIFPDTEFIVAVNGYYDQNKQRKYLREITYYLKKYKNVKVISFEEPQSLSKLWNLLIINSSSEKLLVLNDDLKIWKSFRRHLENSGVLQSYVALINSSWSHFLISKSVVQKVGWFDERFPGVGNEDEDFECRLVFRNIGLNNYSVRGLRNIVFGTKDFSYGPDTAVVNRKYVKANKVFFDTKWDVSNIELPGYKFVRITGKYMCLKTGMDTPDFYPHLNTLHQ